MANLIQSLLNPQPGQQPQAPGQTYAPPITEAGMNRMQNQAYGRNAATEAAQNNSLAKSFGSRFGQAGRFFNAQQGKNAWQRANANAMAQTNIESQFRPAMSQYQSQFDQGALDRFLKDEQLRLNRDQLAVSAFSPILGALTAFAG